MGHNQWRQRAACADQPSTRWDLDAGTLGEWQLGRRTCAGCPVRDDCLVDARRHAQRGVIRAGVPYGDDGKPLSDAQLAARTRGRVPAPLGLPHAS